MAKVIGGRSGLFSTLLGALLCLSPMAQGAETPCVGQDGDGDGFSCDLDCDDANWHISPAAAEVEGNGVDDNCNGLIDEDDGDQDGAPDDVDCAPLDETIYPAAPESANGVDDDCDGQIDESGHAQDQDGDGYSRTGGDCDDGNALIFPGAKEAVNALDDDCDGQVDENTPVYDDDGDGFCEHTTLNCLDGALPGDCADRDPAIYPGAVEAENGIDDNCNGLVDEDGNASNFDGDGDGYTVGAGDCNDGQPAIHPGSMELANDLDDDCDGRVDEETIHHDDDKDGYCEVEPCQGDALGGDCHDGDLRIYPQAPEVRDGIDNDCDGQIEEGTEDADDDGDGLSETQGDCDDENAEIHPLVDEIPDNGIDDNCDGRIDEDLIFVDDVDVDADGHSLADGDCDDLNPDIYPGAEESCDGRDTDCDGEVDPPDCEGGSGGGSGQGGGCDQGAAGGQGGVALTLMGLLLLARLPQTRRLLALAALLLMTPILGCNDGADYQVSGAVGKLGVSPDEAFFDFGPVNIAETTERTLYLFNGGGGPLTVASVRLEMEDGRDYFTLAEGYSGTLEVGEEVELRLQYNPRAAGTHSATLLINYRASAGADEAGVHAVGLRGRAAELSLGLAPDVIDFGPLHAGEDGSQGLFLKNHGLAPVTLSAVEVGTQGLSWSFAALGQSLPYIIAPGESLDLVVDYLSADGSPLEGAVALEVAGQWLFVDVVGGICLGSQDPNWDEDGDGFAQCGGDCDDTRALVYPGAPEEADGVDRDCDGRIDEGTLAYDDDGDCQCELAPCSGSISPTCQAPAGGDCQDSDLEIHPQAGETLENGIDDDCDGLVDEDGQISLDIDGDGYTEAGGDCQPTNGQVYPHAPEAPSGLDNDCDGVIDEGTSAFDDDQDGYCEGSTCSDGTQGGDCDDGNPDRNPSQSEGSVADGLDNDCDGQVDEGLAAVDGDGDGYALSGGDCDDQNDAIHPGAAEVCNGLDDNCDGVIGAGEVDDDGDGITECQGDCDDSQAAINPLATEICDGLDTNCDGLLPSDELDGDGDGYRLCDGDCRDDDGNAYPGAPEICNGLDDDCDGSPSAEEVDGDGDGYSSCAGDCDDANAALNPGAVEVCNGIDDDCDGQVPASEGDADGDGYAICQGDCDDSVPSIYPEAPELCNGLDDNCNGLVEPAGDADQDGINDAQDGYGDSDGDGQPDCLDADSDGDNLPDAYEIEAGTDPDQADSDGDGYSDLVEAAVGTDGTDPEDNPGTHSDVIYIAPEGEAIEPQTQTLEFDTFIQRVDLYFGFDTSSTMRHELIAMAHPEYGVTAIVGALTCETLMVCPEGEGCATEEMIPQSCRENSDCPQDYFCGVEGVCLDSPLVDTCIPDIHSGVAAWHDFDTFENRLSVQPDSQLTAESVPSIDNDGLNESPIQAASCVGDPSLCSNSNINCATSGIGCPGFREEALRIYTQVSDANEQCYDQLGGCDAFTTTVAGQTLADEKIRFIGLYGTDDNDEDGLGTPQSIAEEIGIASGTVDRDGNPYVVLARNEETVGQTISAVKDLVGTFPMEVRATLSDQPGDHGDALALITSMVANNSGVGNCSSTTGGAPLQVHDEDGDGAPDIFLDVLSGTGVCWDLTALPSNTLYPATTEPQVYHALVEVTGLGALLDRRDIYFLVPPIITEFEY